MSLAFCKNSIIALEALDHPLVVEIIDDHIVSASRVYRECVLEMFGVKFPIDCVPIPLR